MRQRRVVLWKMFFKFWSSGMRKKRGPMARARCGGRLGEAMVMDDARLAGKRTRVGVASRPATKRGRRGRKCFQSIEAEKTPLTRRHSPRP